MNVFAGVGNIARIDDDVQILCSGTNSYEKIRFSIALNKDYKHLDDSPDADFFNCEAWGKTAEFIHKYFTKGKSIAISGEFRNNNYIDKNGNKVYSDFIYVQRASFAGNKSDNANNTNSSNSGASNKVSKDDFMDIPDNVEEALPFD